MTEWISKDIPPIGFNLDQKLWVYSPKAPYIKLGSCTVSSFFEYMEFPCDVEYWTPREDDAAPAPPRIYKPKKEPERIRWCITGTMD